MPASRTGSIPESLHSGESREWRNGMPWGWSAILLAYYSVSLGLQLVPAIGLITCIFLFPESPVSRAAWCCTHYD